MEQEKSCGAIVINKNNKILLVHHNAGHWDFPKGHIENGETEEQTAIREVKEECNIDIEIISDTYFTNTYSPKTNVIKDVHYFIAKATSTKIINQQIEVSEAKWVDIEDVMDVLTFDIDKEIFLKTMRALSYD